jgi:hypothetical protein
MTNWRLVVQIRVPATYWQAIAPDDETGKHSLADP